MDRRQVLQSSAGMVATTAWSGCLGELTGSAEQAQSGSGNPCDDPRLVDYQAVDEYRHRGVYLQNGAESVYTACVRVTEADSEPEEDGQQPPPLSHRGYEMHPGTAVEIVTFDDQGRYTVTVSLDATSKQAQFEVADSTADGTGTWFATFEITGAANVEVTRHDG
ncbi:MULTISPECIES: hypothetical protein [Haloarcula]|uniref:hypothetical protein n=1 Tax=Haloarcula TaxID=2237 RepID=UPI0023EBB91E|nr:hypothetical protein [Halomicroarcula sp. XH51]